MSTGQSWKELDAIIARWAVPDLTQSAFERVGDRKFVRAAPNGDLLIVEFRGYTDALSITFFLEWAAVPESLRQYIESLGEYDEPDLEWGLIRSRAIVPDEFRDMPEDETLWQVPLGDEGHVAVGAQIRDELRRTLTPMWLELSDHSSELWQAWRGFADLNFSWWDARGLREAILHVDDGDPDAVERWLAEAEAVPLTEDRSDLARWLHHRLAQRLAGS